ncbi:zinc finger protein 585A-like [Melanaphis sacchari]|uniref:Zinc finger protein 778 n=1 Tax=Melanaphis sacchari TaxID=742174 RepID=A0A2H8TQE0_9HEMI|nr:zinc finger protein 585A-like [Melanaphis sacchari]XP_025203280.1 zinc finger protein 585A-like [Melanaphis sacchari]
MASTLEDREELSSKCFICNVKVTTRSSYNIYCTFMPQRELLLIDVMSKILKKVLNPSQMRSSLLCRRCFTLFDELDQISTRFKKLQTDIIKRYTSTCNEYKDGNFLNTVNSMTPVKIEELSHSEQENDNKSFNDDENSEKSFIALNEIVENIISRIQADETMDSDEDIKKCTSDISKNKIINEEVTKHIDSVDIPLSVIEKPTCETKLSEQSVGDNYKCEQCDDTFLQATDLKNHFSIVHTKPKIVFCSVCNKSFSTKQSLNNHLSKEHNTLDKETINNKVDSISPTVKTENETSLCDTDSNIVSEASADYMNDAPEGVVIDVKPEFSIDNSMYLEEVVQEENEDDDFEWKEEQQINYIEENIIEDSSSAIEETKTPLSGSEKSDKKQIKKGRKKRGSSRSGERACLPAIHSCGLCGKKWRTVTELKSHIQSHSSIRPYVCEICGQAYKMKKALDVHIGMHNGIHPFTCEYCNKSFTQKVGLQKHIPIHTGYTRFQCDLCGKRFIHQKSFHIHTMTHTGEKHVKCSECGLAVLSQSHLKRHLRVHTGERPYACPICGKRFAEKYNMNAHVHIHENNSGNAPRRNRNHICQLCGMSYDRKHKLEYHLASAHNKIDNKVSQDQELVQLQQPKIEYFQENSQGHQIINVDNNAIEHNGSTTMITVSGVKLPISLDGAPIMVTAMPQEPHTTNLVPLNIPAGSLLTYRPSNTSDNNDQQIVDGSQNSYMPQNPVTIQLS